MDKPLSVQTDKKNKKLTPQTYRDISTFRRQRAAHKQVDPPPPDDAELRASRARYVRSLCCTRRRSHPR